jgi:hypothetical protein
LLLFRPYFPLESLRQGIAGSCAGVEQFGVRVLTPREFLRKIVDEKP